MLNQFYTVCPSCLARHGEEHKDYCHSEALANLGAKGVPPTSSEDSTTTDPQAEKHLHAAADRLLYYKKNAETLQSLTGMPSSEFWPIALTVLTERMSGQLDTLATLLTKPQSDLNAPNNSGPQPAPSSQASTQPVASDVRTRDESPAQFSWDADMESLLVQRVELTEQRLQAQINLLGMRVRGLEQDFYQRSRENDFLPHLQTSDTTQTASSTTSQKESMARKATTPSANSRSTSKRSRPPKPTMAGSVSSSAKRSRGKTGAISSSLLAKLSAATRRRNSRKGA
jgi:hypothetical protein